MVILWIVLTLLVAFGLIMLIGDRLLAQSLSNEGICPVCNGAGGPCDHCNGYGVIVDANKIQSQLPEDTSKAVEKAESLES